eukprot:5680613-Amphidinium_carterae.1
MVESRNPRLAYAPLIWTRTWHMISTYVREKSTNKMINGKYDPQEPKRVRGNTTTRAESKRPFIDKAAYTLAI